MPTIRERNGKYQVMIRLQGCAPLIKTFPKGTTKKEGREWGLDQERKLKLGDVPTLRRKELQRWSLKALIERYLECDKFKRKRSSANERVALEAFLDREKSLCSKSLAELRRQDFIAYRDRRMETVKVSTLRRELNPLRAMFRLAKEEWEIPIDSPLQGLELDPEPEHRVRRLSREEQSKLSLAAMDCRGKKQWKLWQSMMAAALDTAMRRGELLKLQWGDIDFEKKTLYVRPGKTRKGRLLPLSKFLGEHLRQYRSRISEQHRTPEATVYPISPTAHSQAWKRLLIRAGVQGLTFHDLRHEAASRFDEKPIELTRSENEYMCGHKGGTNASYVHSELERIRAKIDAGYRGVKVISHNEVRS
jgi:integrase